MKNIEAGFTLLEIMVVIGIIGLLAGLGIGAYSLGRGRLTVDLETDRLISMMGTLRTATQKQGRCFGLHITKTSLEKFESAYKNPVETCAAEETKSSAGLGAHVAIREVKIDGVEVEKTTIRFLPPSGMLEIFPAGKKAEVEVGLDNEEKGKTIFISSLTGLIFKE